MKNKILLTFIFLCINAPVFAGKTVQNLIDSGDIEKYFVNNNTTLDLSNQELQSLQGIKNIPFKNYPNLEQLWLNNNQLTSISELSTMTVLANLRELHVTNNKLEELNLNLFNTFPMLYVFNAGFNDVHSIIPKNNGLLQNLEVLFLNNNKLASLPTHTFSSCPQLQALYLQDNALNSLPDSCFKGLGNLRLLYLQNNALTTLPAHIFSDLKNIHVLYLRNNALEKLEKNWNNGLENISLLDLSDNKLNDNTTIENDPDQKAAIEQFLSVVRKEVYQDILVDGVTIKEGVKDCEIRWPAIKKILDQYERPFTVLDIGASEGYFSLRIATEYKDQCTCVMLEGDNTLLLPHICQLNKKLNNIVVLEKFITPQDLKELGNCEHFDLILAFNVVHQLGDAWKETIDQLLTLGDHILIETPPPGCRTSAHKENLPLIEAYLAQNNHGKVVGQVPRYGRPGLPAPDQKYSNVYLFDMHKNILNKPTWGSPHQRFYALNSNFKEKTLYKPRIHKTINWKKGINLWTFKNLHGVYPARDVINQEIKRLSVLSHQDFMPWNMIIQGNSLELIDWEDNNSPESMHDHETCIALFEA